MEPRDIDKLFRDRLQNSAPTPPADLWSKLQERMETEVGTEAETPAPAPQQEKKQIMLWPKRYYSMAASVSLLLAVGVAFFSLRTNPWIKENKLAQSEAAQTITIEPNAAPSAGNAAPAEAALAAAETGNATSASAVSGTTAPATRPAAPANAVAQASPKAADEVQALKVLAKPATQTPVKILAATKPALEPAITPTVPADVAAQPVRPVVLAAAHTQEHTQPVEIIIIKRSAGAQVVSNSDEEELSGFEKKQRLAKGIIRQARNLTSGEPIDLSDIGINASRIAFETQIGNQKFSKVINL